jgi:phosphohistidine phosphatase
VKTLLILRHAKSSWKDLYLADHDRLLNKRGKRDAPRMGQLLLDEGLLPDLIISSTAKRARKTVEGLLEGSGYSLEVQYTRDFYHGYPETFIAILSELDDKYEQVMVVGHNPGLEELLEVLTGDYERTGPGAAAHSKLGGFGGGAPGRIGRGLASERIELITKTATGKPQLQRRFFLNQFQEESYDWSPSPSSGRYCSIISSVIAWRNSWPPN